MSPSEPRGAGERRRARLAEARLYLIVDARPSGRDAEPLLEAALANGVDVVQLREKSLSDEEVVEAAAGFRRACDRHGALFLVNDRPELVEPCAADGVHVGQDDVPVADARRAVGDERLVGLSTHAPAEIAAAEGADYVGVGPVWRTPTKEGRPGVGLELVEVAARTATVPFFAIGGIDATNVEEVLDAGARRIAVVRAIGDAPDPGRAAAALAAALEARPL